MSADPYKIPLAHKGKFYVWRRNDGYVATSNGRMPAGWTIQEGARKGEVVSFEQLGYYEYWPDALNCIEQHTKGEQNGNAAN